MHKHFSVPTKPTTEVLADFTAAPKNCEDAVTAAGSPHSSLSSESTLEGFLRESKSEELITIEQPGKKISINARLANIEASTTKILERFAVDEVKNNYKSKMKSTLLN